MKVGDMVRLMQPWCKMKVSTVEQVDRNGIRLWSEYLTEAQKLAYWEREIVNHIIDEGTLSIYCILKGEEK